MSFQINETSIRNIGSTRDNENRTTINVSRSFNLVSSTPSNVIAARQALVNFGVFSGALHPQNQFYFCDRISLNQVSPIFFEATAEYRSPAFDEQDNPNADPVLEAPDITFSTATSTEPIDTTVGGNAIQTLAGENYQGITKRISDLVVTIKRNYAIFDPNSFYDYINTVNADTFLGFAPGRCLIDDINAVLKSQDNFLFWEITVKIIIRKPFECTDAQAWQVRLRHEGFYRLITRGMSDVSVRAIDENGEPTAQPVPLDANGFQQAHDDPPVWLFFEIYESSNFSDMNLGV